MQIHFSLVIKSDRPRVSQAASLSNLPKTSLLQNLFTEQPVPQCAK